MANQRKSVRTRPAVPRDAESVEEFMAALDHPLKATLERVRSSIRGASPAIAEGIKWKAPSFRLRDTQRYFATVNIHGSARTEDCVLVILHQDAKVAASGAARLAIRDPQGLLDWLAKDRAALRFASLAEVKARQAALQDIVRQWIAGLPHEGSP